MLSTCALTCGCRVPSPRGRWRHLSWGWAPAVSPAHCCSWTETVSGSSSGGPPGHSLFTGYILLIQMVLSFVVSILLHNTDQLTKCVHTQITNLIRNVTIFCDHNQQYVIEVSWHWYQYLLKWWCYHYNTYSCIQITRCTPGELLPQWLRIFRKQKEHKCLYDVLRPHHLNIHAHTHTRTHVRTHARTNARTHERTHARTHARTHTHTHTHTHTLVTSPHFSTFHHSFATCIDPSFI